MEENLEDEIIVLTNDDGEEESFEFLEVLEYEGAEYVVLTPVASEDEEEESEELEIVIFRMVYDEESPEKSLLVTEEDEEIVQSVFQIFQQHYDAAYDEEETIDNE